MVLCMLSQSLLVHMSCHCVWSCLLGVLSWVTLRCPEPKAQMFKSGPLFCTALNLKPWTRCTARVNVIWSLPSGPFVLSVTNTAFWYVELLTRAVNALRSHEKKWCRNELTDQRGGWRPLRQKKFGQILENVWLREYSKNFEWPLIKKGVTHYCWWTHTGDGGRFLGSKQAGIGFVCLSQSSAEKQE